MATLATIPTKKSKSEEAAETITLRLVWVMVLRVVMTSVLLGATIVFAYKGGDSFLGASPKFLLYVIGATYFLTIVYAVWYRLGKAIRLLAQTQLTIDLVFWACITYATGGIISGFTFLFDLWVIVAAVLLGSRAAFVSAATSVLLLGILVTIMATGLLAPLADQTETIISTKEYLYFLAVNVVALFVVAVLVNSLVARLELTGKGLEIERERRADLAQLHEDMIRSLAVGVATTNNQGEILMMNPAGRRALNITSGDVIGRTLDIWLPEFATPEGVGDSRVLRGKSDAIESGGNKIPIEYVIAPLVGSDGNRRGSIVAFSDQSEVQRLEAEVESSRRLAALGELAASLAHEIRNPLGAVSGSFQILAENSTLETDDAVLVGIISRELTRMKHLVTDMLHYSRPRETELVSTDIGKLVDETVKAFLMGPESIGLDVSINIDVQRQLLAVADQSQIRQVLWNLLRNAAQATESGDRIEAAAFKQANLVVVEIRDTGPGIDGSDIKKIFDPFYSTRERGIGLGLALCKRIMEKHRGKINAFSRPKGGSVFRIALPVDDKS